MQVDLVYLLYLDHFSSIITFSVDRYSTRILRHTPIFNLNSLEVVSISFLYLSVKFLYLSLGAVWPIDVDNEAALLILALNLEYLRLLLRNWTDT